MQFDPIAITLGLFVLLALLVPAPVHWRRQPRVTGAGTRGADDPL